MIDAHVHLYPAEVVRDPGVWAAACGETHWTRLCTRKRKSGDPVQLFPTVDQLLSDMDDAGIECAMLLGWYWEKPSTCRAQNEFYAECIRAHGDRLGAFAAVHPGERDSVRHELQWARDHGFRGVGELSPHSQGVAVDDPGWNELLQVAGELHLPVNIHVTDPRTRAYLGRVDTPLDDFVAMAKKYPATQFILAHWGGGLAFDPENRALRNVWYDTAASPLMYDATVWAKAFAAVGPGRIIFGSDYPLRLYPAAGQGVGLQAFASEAIRQSAGRHAADVLGKNFAKVIS